ncbi:bifunctional GNAT family N-acetyltransferase/nucleoside triphosphate pyrophosphohydrolase family protein [Georgenia wangjunii]|uniref:bifunctional GNAT family N-acetyltransferase/nucleoside triphosphate pyrophosphohydrolase family protein n=1 Tax=Georgenia wangjunii TaxID=3117730 RepID=UPI002F26C194
MEPFALRSPDGGILLSAPTADDVDRVTELCQDEDVARWTTVPAPYARAHGEQFVCAAVPASWERGSPTWAVRVAEDDGGWRLVGMVGLDGVGDGSADIGYWLGPEARGRGVMHRAVGLALDAGFDRLGLERVQWRAFVGNWPSWRVVWRHGFRREGTVRGLGLQRGRRVDEWIGTLLRTDDRRPALPWDGPDVARADPAGAADARRRPAGFVDPDVLVAEFHRTYDVPVATDAARVDRERVHLRMALVVEELAELVAAVYGPAAAREIESAFTRAVAADDGTRDTVATADALGDLVYVVYGMAQECGIPLPAVLAEIHASNLSKVGADGRPVLRGDGKVLKGPRYTPPDIAGVLARHNGDHAY